MRYTIELSFAETSYIKHSAIVADRNGTPLNCMATVHVTGVGLNKAPLRVLSIERSRHFLAVVGSEKGPRNQNLHN